MMDDDRMVSYEKEHNQIYLGKTYHVIFWDKLILCLVLIDGSGISYDGAVNSFL
jgi:hypothetical protein